MNYGIGNVKGKSSGGGTYKLVSMVEPTFDDTLEQYVLDTTNIIDFKTGQPININDYDVDVDKYEVKIVSVNNETLEMSENGTFVWINTTSITNPPIARGQYIHMPSGGGGSGTPLYLHNLSWGVDSNGLKTNLHGLFILNDSPDPFTFNTLLQYLTSNGFSQTSSNDYTHRYSGGAYGTRAYGDGSYTFLGITKTYNNDSITFILRNTSYNGTIGSSSFTADGYKEDIIPLATMVAPTPVALYQHNISIEGKINSSYDIFIQFMIFNDNATALTKQNVLDWLNNNGFNASTSILNGSDYYPATAVSNQNSILESKVCGIGVSNNYFKVFYFPLWEGTTINGTTVYDKVISI